jgi:hypothetical protein
VTTSEITQWFMAYRLQHPGVPFMAALTPLLAAHPEAGRYDAGTVAECFNLATP